MKKVILILVDGMRPDGFLQCGHSFPAEMLAHSVHDLAARTVMPSVTLPCHMSLFHSVTPERHGILTNTYVPQVRPVRGICEVLRAAGKSCSFFYNWEELKDLSRPDSLATACYVSGHVYGYEEANPRVTKACLDNMAAGGSDFSFLYLGWTDAAGHNNGWMSDEYMRSIRGSLDCIRSVCEAADDDTLVVLTADHGGHGRSHGSDMDEDMTIPILFWNRTFSSREITGTSILDIAPTVLSVLGVAPDPEWEGKAVEL